VAARLPYVEREQVPREVQTTYDIAAKAGGRGLNFYRLMAHHAQSVPPFVRWYAALREGALNFTNRFNEALGTELELTAPPGAPRT
jgi:hypothetical protein